MTYQPIQPSMFTALGKLGESVIKVNQVYFYDTEWDEKLARHLVSFRSDRFETQHVSARGTGKLRNFWEEKVNKIIQVIDE